VSKSFKTLRAEHSLVAQAFHTAHAANARRILLVSAHTGDGKSHLAKCIQQHASVVTDEPFQVLSFATLCPQEEIDYGYVWVDGVALLEGEGAAVLTPAVRASFDGVLLIARGMVTTRAELAECADRLRTLDMPVLGGVWNAVDCPPPAEVVRAFREGLRTWPPQLPPGVFARQFRRSS
jgi:chloramphenicol 3-O-phosphotransferase